MREEGSPARRYLCCARHGGDVAALIAVTAILRVLGAAASGSGAAFEQSALWDADRLDRLRDVSGIGGHRSGQANCCAHEGHACPPVCAPE
jgi:hypothetical protein